MRSPGACPQPVAANRREQAEDTAARRLLRKEYEKSDFIGVSMLARRGQSVLVINGGSQPRANELVEYTRSRLEERPTTCRSVWSIPLHRGHAGKVAEETKNPRIKHDLGHLDYLFLFFTSLVLTTSAACVKRTHLSVLCPDVPIPY